MSRFFFDLSQTDGETNDAAVQRCGELEFGSGVSAYPRRPPRARDASKMSDTPETRNENGQKKKPLPIPPSKKLNEGEKSKKETNGVGQVGSNEKVNGKVVADLVSQIESVSKGGTSLESRNKGEVKASPPIAPKSRVISQAKSDSNSSTLPTLTSHAVEDVHAEKESDVHVKQDSTAASASASSLVDNVEPIVMRKKKKAEANSTIGELIGRTSQAFVKVPVGVETSRKSVHSPKLFRSTRAVKSTRKSKISPDAVEMPSAILNSDLCPPCLSDLPTGDARTMVAHEIYKTEHSYVKGLELVAQVFMPPLSTILESSEVAAIFANMESILTFNQELLYSLYMRLSAWTERTCIGDLFLNRIARFRIYTVYCNNYDSAEETVAMKIKKKKDFEAALNSCYADPRCQPGITLLAYLLTPVQRIPRYRLLLKQLLDKTSVDHRDYEILQEAHEKMNELNEYVNDQLKEAQGKKALNKLTSQVQGLETIAEDSGRTLVKEGSVYFMATRKLYQAILFTDLIVFAIRADGKHSEVELALDLSTVWIEDLEDLDPATTQEDAIEIYTPDRPYTIYVKSRNEKKLWLQKLNETIAKHLNRVSGKDNSVDQVDIRCRVASFSYKDYSHYVGHWTDSKRHGRGQMMWSNKTSYKGEWKEDERSGEGEMTYNTGEKYKGQWHNDKQNGYGELRYCNDDVYKGEWRLGVKHGKAVVEFANGDRFEGTFVNGNIEGNGVWESKKTGAMYRGLWKNSQRNGQGTLKTAHGHEYKGEFKDNFMDGQGKMIYSDGSTYEGAWKKNLRSGKGTWIRKSGQRYEGRWMDDIPDIQGKMVYSNKDVYVGSWHAGKRHGVGKMQFSNGDVYEGQFKSDHLTGKALYEYADGSSYDGEVVDGYRQGEGKMIYPDGSCYQGQWKLNCREGTGEITWPHDVVYHGQWKCDKPHGRGVLMNKLDMSRYDGDWENGQRHGHGVETSSRGKYDGEWQYGMRHGKGTECSLVGTIFEGTWQFNKKHGRGYRKLVSGVTDYQVWQHGSFMSDNMDATAVDLPVIAPIDFS